MAAQAILENHIFIFNKASILLIKSSSTALMSQHGVAY